MLSKREMEKVKRVPMVDLIKRLLPMRFSTSWKERKRPFEGGERSTIFEAMIRNSPNKAIQPGLVSRAADG
jgi:hypothetical protein